MSNTKVWAHRGASFYAPENTLPAFALAHKMKADGVELDVHLTKDGQLVVTHDFSIDRVSDGSGLVSEMTLEQLRQYSFAKLHEDYGNVTIPLLTDVYKMIAPTGMSVNVEIKSSAAMVYEGIEQTCLDAAREYGMQQRVIYSSFDHYALQRLRELDSTAKIGLLYSANLYQPWNYAKSLQAALHPPFWALRNLGFTQNAQAAGIPVHAWTIDEPEAICFALSEGIDAIITNKPDVAYDLRERKDF